MPLDVDLKIDPDLKPDLKPVLKADLVDLSVATVADTVALDVPALVDYQRGENVSGEATLSATINGEPLSQTLPMRGTGLLLFDPVTRNWSFLPVPIPDGLQFVELIHGAAL